MAKLRPSLLVFLLACCAPGFTQAMELSIRSRKNPIRKVVTMLQDMQTKVTEEGKKEEDLFEKFMCYCKNNVGTLKASIKAAQAKVEDLRLDLEAALEKKKQTEANLKEHKASRDEANDAMEKATAIRKKEAKAFNKYKSDSETNIDATGKAIGAVEKGMGSFLQTREASVLKEFAMTKATMSDSNRDDILAFLSGTESDSDSYAPASGEIVGILKQMKDTMVADLKEATQKNDEAEQAYASLMKSKKKEVETLQVQIEKELKLVGDFEIKFSEMSNDLEETEESLAADQKFLAELEKGCKTKEAEWAEVCKLRQEELKALADTIKVLNDDDALELFKKTLPGSSAASLVQIQVTTSSMKRRALEALRRGHRHNKHMPARPEMDLIEMALRGKTQGFEKVMKMIDRMVTNLQREQKEDDQKKEYCEKSLDKTEDQKKVLDNEISDSSLAIDDLNEALTTLKEEIKALEDGIKALDKSVADATDQRSNEAADFQELISSDTTAKEILLFAKNRLNKFYNPKLYKPPSFRQSDPSFFQVSARSRSNSASESESDDELSFDRVVAAQKAAAAPPPPPEAVGPYQKKSEESGGVIAMIDLLVADLEKEMTTAKVDEKNAQEEYETLMSDAADKRSQDTKALTEKGAAKAQSEEELEAEKEKKKGLDKERMEVMKEIYSLHGECDWLMKFYQVRKEARAGEVDALGKAKAVLSGADYSLLQTSRHAVVGFLAPIRK